MHQARHPEAGEVPDDAFLRVVHLAFYGIDSLVFSVYGVVHQGVHQEVGALSQVLRLEPQDGVYVLVFPVRGFVPSPHGHEEIRSYDEVDLAGGQNAGLVGV